MEPADGRGWLGPPPRLKLSGLTSSTKAWLFVGRSAADTSVSSARERGQRGQHHNANVHTRGQRGQCHNANVHTRGQRGQRHNANVHTRGQREISVTTLTSTPGARERAAESSGGRQIPSLPIGRCPGSGAGPIRFPHGVGTGQLDPLMSSPPPPAGSLIRRHGNELQVRAGVDMHIAGAGRECNTHVAGAGGNGQKISGPCEKVLPHPAEDPCEKVLPHPVKDPCEKVLPSSE
ncbi:unnamed protein product [Gadus morhua 'NCC']